MDKVCRGCLVAKPLTEYYLDRGKPAAQCKICHNGKAKLWGENNRDKKAAMDLHWQQTNRERYRANQRKWRLANPERMSIYRKKWLEANREFARISHLSAEQKRRAARRKASGEIPTNVWISRVLEFNSHCAYCLQPLDTSYHMEHMYPLSRGGSHTIDNVVPACPTCNYKKSDKTLLEFVSQVVEMR